MTQPGSFWEKPLKLANMIDVGIRSSYVASWHAAPIMLAQKSGLIIFTSASGAVHYVYGPAYGAHKASMDKFAADMGVDFEGTGVSTISLWMGALLTDRLLHLIDSDREKYGYLEAITETPEFTGHIIWALFNDPKLTTLNGKTLIVAEEAIRYGIKDANDRQPPSYRDTHQVAPSTHYPYIIR